ncbi:MAG: bacillithiol system redox-active protein YtxJ [Bacteroidota bacterium]
MGLFGNLFGSKETKEEKELPWISLTTKEQLVEIKERSKDKPQLIFKHSTTCGISRMVLGMFSKDYPLNENNADLYFLDLHSYREVSNEVAILFQVLHQSPQLLVIKNGATAFHTSHGAITEVNLEQFG